MYERFYRQWEKEQADRRRKQSLIAALLICVVFLVLVGFQKNIASVQLPEVLSALDEQTAPEQESKSEQSIKNMNKSDEMAVVTETICGTVRSGQSFSSIMGNHGFRPPVIAEMVDAFDGVFDCSKISVGDEYQVVTDRDGTLVSLSIMPDSTDSFTLTRTEDGFAALKEEAVLEKKLCRTSGTIEYSLFGAITETGEKDQLAIQFAEIFAWDIDFGMDLREGDQFAMVFEKYYKDGEFVRYGNILAAEYRNDRKTFQAVYYQDSQCGGDYFTPEGRSLRRSFLRSPLQFTRISSGYSQRRFHPVLKTYRPHLGIDFAAPVGTPVWAVADGVVTQKGWKNGNGNMVCIRHPNGYETMYNHLSRYGKEIKNGKQVGQKDVIGYVGTTGLSTGPHLDYRMKKNGTFVNPLKEEFPSGTPVPDVSLTQFQEVAKKMLAVLADERSPRGTEVAFAGDRD